MKNQSPSSPISACGHPQAAATGSTSPASKSTAKQLLEKQVVFAVRGWPQQQEQEANLTASDQVAPDFFTTASSDNTLGVPALDTTEGIDTTTASLKRLDGIPVTAREPVNPRVNTCFVYGLDGNLTYAELFRGIVSSTPVTAATREGGTVKLHFASPFPPDRITIFGLQLRVRPVKPRPRQCQQCGRFGHVTEVAGGMEGGHAHRYNTDAAFEACSQGGGPRETPRGVIVRCRPEGQTTSQQQNTCLLANSTDVAPAELASSPFHRS
ncbi:hypothetical protein MRX96_050529 [Rhipicephalus microplus]